MGWWNVDSEVVIGDTVLDALHDAFVYIAREYEEDVGRKPTRKEWEMLLSKALRRTEEPLVRDGAIESVRLEPKQRKRTTEPT